MIANVEPTVNTAMKTMKVRQLLTLEARQALLTQHADEEWSPSRTIR
jgi:hypothetical protein